MKPNDAIAEAWQEARRLHEVAETAWAEYDIARERAELAEVAAIAAADAASYLEATRPHVEYDSGRMHPRGLNGELRSWQK